RRLLLVLDNCEHLLPALPLAASLLAASPGLKVLATSRERLHLRGEREFPVEPLALPEPPKAIRRATPLPGLAAVAAVRLFVERAEEAKSGFALTEENAPAVVAICRRLDGLPLAIELAAARVRHLSSSALLTRLERQLPLLVDGPRDLPDRQRTLSATIAWSHALLAPVEQALFRRLAIFAGGFDLAAAEAVASQREEPTRPDSSVFTIPDSAVFAGLASLMDKSFLRQTIGNDGEARFAMLETIREDAAERLAASGEAGEARRAHATYYLTLAERAAPQLGGPDQGAWLERLEVEHENLQAALGWAVGDGDTELGLLLARRLARFWHIRGYAGEGRAWFERLLAAAGTLPSAARAWPTYNAGLLAWAQGDLHCAATWFEQSLALFRELEDKKGEATALGMLGAVAEHQEDHAQAVKFNEESLALYRELGNTTGVATMLDAIGGIAAHRGDYPRAAVLYNEGLALYRELGDRSGAARVLSNLGDLALLRGNVALARSLNRESLALHWEVGYKEGVAYALENLAGVAVAQREPERAARLFGAAEALREAIGTPLPPSERAGYERDVAAVRRLLGGDAFAAAWATGRSLPLENARAEALGGPASVGQSEVAE
ncbi:MAG: tetratricopeptide repeat protein, partial [Chloroflexota bacterium]|nr:tetratricopeptide repeat protein [Chloroflexota bacterium]